jgi:hypothetical protein
MAVTTETVISVTKAKARIAACAAVLLASVWLLVNAATAQAGLTFKRLDGSAIRFSVKPRVWCGPWDDLVARPSLHVVARSARRGWELSAVTRDIVPGQPIEFPNEFVSSRPRGAQLFVATPRIEASSAEEESSGSLVFSRASCQVGGLIQFSVRAVLGSELFGGTRVRVSGAYRGYVSETPSTYP